MENTNFALVLTDGKRQQENFIYEFQNYWGYMYEGSVIYDDTL